MKKVLILIILFLASSIFSMQNYISNPDSTSVELQSQNSDEGSVYVSIEEKDQRDQKQDDKYLWLNSAYSSNPSARFQIIKELKEAESREDLFEYNRLSNKIIIDRLNGMDNKLIKSGENSSCSNKTFFILTWAGLLLTSLQWIVSYL